MRRVNLDDPTPTSLLAQFGGTIKHHDKSPHPRSPDGAVAHVGVHPCTIKDVLEDPDVSLQSARAQVLLMRTYLPHVSCHSLNPSSVVKNAIPKPDRNSTWLPTMGSSKWCR